MAFEDRVNEALGIVRRDLSTHSNPPIGLSVTDIEGTVHIELGGDVYGGDPLYERVLNGVDALLVAVADAVQTLVSYNAGDEVWPVCPSHGYGLHPELTSSAVWVCRPHDHTVSRIGELAP